MRTLAQVGARAGVLALWILIPAVAAIVLGSVGWERSALTIGLSWKGLVFPHDWLFRRTASGSTAVFSSNTALLVATVQWCLLALLFGRAVRPWSIRASVWAAPVVVLAVALLAHLLIRAFGLTYEADLP